MKRFTSHLWIIVALLAVFAFIAPAHARPTVLNDVMTVDQGGSIDFLDGTGLKLAGVEVTATAAELNIADGITATLAEINALDGSASGGTAGTNGLTVTEAPGIINKTTFTFANTLTATDGSAEGETQVLYTFPAGRIYVIGGAINATSVNTATEADTNDTFTYSIGTAAANDAADLTGTEVDIFAAVALSDGAVTLTNQWEADFTAGADSVFDGTSTAATLNLNMGIADACITTNDFSATFTGSATVFWINLGDD